MTDKTRRLPDGTMTADIEMMRPGWPKVDRATLATSAPGVFVAGDLAHGTRLAIDAVASGKAAARSVYTYVTGRSLDLVSLTEHQPLAGYRREQGYESIRRQAVPVREPAERLGHPADAKLLIVSLLNEVGRTRPPRCHRTSYTGSWHHGSRESPAHPRYPSHYCHRSS